MAKTVEFWFDFGSPASYLAWFQLPKIAAARGATIARRADIWRSISSRTRLSCK